MKINQKFLENPRVENLKVGEFYVASIIGEYHELESRDYGRFDEVNPVILYLGEYKNQKWIQVLYKEKIVITMLEYIMFELA